MRTLTLDGQYGTRFCIETWLRDEQVRANCAAVKGRLQGPYEKREDPIAIVCYGPSLADMWEKVKDFKYVMTCSGAHKFLIERGIVPNFHTDVDPRPHKAKLIGKPHPKVEYLIASACHPEYVALLKGFNLKLWHVFDPNEEPMRILPQGEWALTGGCGAGLRAMVLARFLGFTEQHIFGMDGCEGKTGKHAGPHPNQPKEMCKLEYKGVKYFTTPAMLEAARTVPHEMNELPDVTATFYGDGLVQAIMAGYKREKNKTVAIAMSKPELISPYMREMNAKLHREKVEYGVGGAKHAKTVEKLRESMKAESVLDYGAGKGRLAASLTFPIWEYDPCVPGKEDSPRPADLVVCTDVLEHIEPDKLKFVLDDLGRVTKKVGYFVIHTGAAIKTYPDGRNTHLIQEGKAWWEKELKQFFSVGKIFEVGKELHVIVGPGGKKKKPLATAEAGC